MDSLVQSPRNQARGGCYLTSPQACEPRRPVPAGRHHNGLPF
jgi:hypothetical protein